jgi:LysM repeat protein
MKILKIFGVVVGIHLFALILIFANPGCSSTTKNIPAPSDTVTAQPPPSVSVPLEPTGISVPENSPLTVPSGFNPDAPAVPSGGSPGVRFNPTRPGTPAATTLAPAPVADVTPATTYTVQNGDNLWSVSKKFKQTTAQIAAANNLKTNAVLRPGQKLIIPGKATTPGTVGLAAETAPAAGAAPRAAEAAAVKSGETVKHVVRPGESLSMIAQQYGVRQGDIAVANNIADPQKIRAGMELTIPGWQPAGKSGKSSRSSGKSAPAANAPKSIIPTEPEPAAAPAATAPQIPIIRIDDSPIAPAPKSP